jgi:CheY-like chemotaxis protein
MSNPAILIVEDDEIVCPDIANKLRKLGNVIAGSTDTGEEALQKAHNNLEQQAAERTAELVVAMGASEKRK